MIKCNTTGLYIIKHKLLEQHDLNDNVLWDENYQFFFFAGQIPKCLFRVELGEKLIVCGYDNLYLIFFLHVLHQVNSL